MPGTMVVRLMINGRQCWKSLGPVTLYSLAEVREKNHAMRRAQREGKDPFEGLGKPTGPTFGEAYDEYIKAKLTQWAPSNRERELRHHNFIFDKLDAFKALPLASIDLAAKNKAIATFEPGSRNHRDCGIYINAVLKMAETGAVRQTGEPAPCGDEVARRAGNLPQARQARHGRKRGAALRDPDRSPHRRGDRQKGTREMDEGSGDMGRDRHRRRGQTGMGAPGQPDEGARAAPGATHPANGCVAGQAQHRRDAPVQGAQHGLHAGSVAVADRQRRHGARAPHFTWVAEATDYTKDLGELCLAHDNRSKVERAYQRSDLLEKRREIMEAWSGYVAG
jgi:hypothetical protein